MAHARSAPGDAADSPRGMPSRVTSARGETLEDAAFSAGAALAHLDLVARRAAVPQALLRDRLALRAAAACMAVAGRRERAAELRDAIHLRRPGDRPGPAGEVYLSWRRAVDRPISVKALHRALPEVAPEAIATWLDSGQGAPVARAAAVLETVLAAAPGAETPGLILADAALAQALGWSHVMPLLAAGMRRADLRQRGDALRLALHRAATGSAVDAARLAGDLARRAAGLTAVAPKLRARAAGQAVEMFRTRDALAPAALAALMSDRAARRLCDRLVRLGALRELTGRDTFRLYGL